MAPFFTQCEPLIGISTAEKHVNRMTAFGTTTAAGCRYDVDSAAFDEENASAVFFATFTWRHVGDGGTALPANKETNSHYVYGLRMNGDAKVESVQKVWNTPWAIRELDWAKQDQLTPQQRSNVRDSSGNPTNIYYAKYWAMSNRRFERQVIEQPAVALFASY